MAFNDSIARRLRKSSLTSQMVRYFVVAAVGLLADVGSVVLAAEVFGIHYLAAAGVGFMLGLGVTYFLSNSYVFGKPKTGHVKLFTVFGLVGLVGLAILSLLMWLFTDVLGLHYLLSKALATVFVFAWNFFGRKALYDEPETA